MLKTKNVQLLPQVGKIKRTLHFNWLPKQARWAHFSHLGFRAGHASKSSLLGHVIIHYFIDQACSFKMAEYWPHSVLHFYWPRPGCALWPVAPASVTFVLGRLENLCFFTEIICWAHWISQVQSAGLPSIFLRAQPCKRKAWSIKAQIFSHLNLTPGQ